MPVNECKITQDCTSARITPAQVEIFVILTLVTNYHAWWRRGQLYFHLGQICIVLGDIYHSSSWFLHTQNDYHGTQVLIPR